MMKMYLIDWSLMKDKMLQTQTPPLVHRNVKVVCKNQHSLYALDVVTNGIAVKTVKYVTKIIIICNISSKFFLLLLSPSGVKKNYISQMILNIKYVICYINNLYSIPVFNLIFTDKTHLYVNKTNF